MTSTHSDSAEDSAHRSCSLEVHDASEKSRSPRRREKELERIDGSKDEAANPPHPAMQKIIWGSGNPNLGTGSNPTIFLPEHLARTIPNIADLVAVDASSIVEPVLKGEKKPQDGQHHSSTSLQDGGPSKRSVKKAARNEARKATRKAAKQKGSGSQPPAHEFRVHEDGLPTCLSSSSDDDLVSGQPPANRTLNATPDQSSNPDNLKSSTHLETSERFSQLHEPPISTQASFDNVGDLPVRAEEVPVMDSSKPAAPLEEAMADDSELLPASQNQHPSQSQQKKEKKSKPPKQPSTPTSLPLSPALIDLRVGHILRCIPHENADSLYVSTIAMGDPEGSENTHKDEETGRIVRTVCSGLRGLILLEQMQDRKVIVMANLKPVTMRGIKSTAMVLAASPPPKEGDDAHSADRVVELVSPPEGSEGGDRVFFEGWDYGEGKGPEKVLNPKKKQWESVQPGMYTSEELTVVFDAERVQGVEGGKGELIVAGGKGRCKVPSLKGARLS